MRRKLVLGVGLAGVLSGSAAVAQFAADRVPPGTPQPKATAPVGGPAPFGGGQPIGVPSAPPAPGLPAPVGGLNPPASLPPAAGGVMPAGGYQAPAGGLQPAGYGNTPAANGFRPAGGPATATPPAPMPNVEVPSALGLNHPLALRAEHGAYFICVKSYSRPARPDPTDIGPTARELAETLAGEIQQAHRGVNVYLFEHVSDERRAEMAAVAAARQRGAAFQAAVDAHRQKSQLQGMEFLNPTDQRLHYRTVQYRDQIAVLIGPYRTEEEAGKALGKVRTWPPPANQLLMDGSAIVKPGPNGKPEIERALLNPFTQAMVVRNPAAPRAPQQAGMDPFLVKLNEGRPYSLLKAAKPWTLGVKSFTAPVVIQSKDEDSGMMRKLGFGKGADALNAGAEQAETLAKALRDPAFKPRPFDAFVLHTRTGSIVTVGQFDDPNDPALLETRRLLMTITFTVTKDKDGRELVKAGERLFGDNIVPMPVPRP